MANSEEPKRAKFVFLADTLASVGFHSAATPRPLLPPLKLPLPLSPLAKTTLKRIQERLLNERPESKTGALLVVHPVGKPLDAIALIHAAGLAVPSDLTEENLLMSAGFRIKVARHNENATLLVLGEWEEQNRLVAAATDAAAALWGGNAGAFEWFRLLFEVAVAKLPGSTLRADKWSERGGCRIGIMDDPPPEDSQAGRFYRDCLSGAQQVVASSLPDISDATVAAIDILLTWQQGDRDAPPPAAETGNSEGTNADQWSPTLPPELRDAPLVNLCLTTPTRITENLARTADGRFFSVWWDSSTALYLWSPVAENYARRAAEPVASYCGKTDWRELFNSAPAGQTREVEADGSAPADAANENAKERKPSRKGIGGKKPLSADEEKKRLDVLRDWWQANEAGIDQKQFCRDKGIKRNMLRRYVNWYSTRQSRNTNSG